MYYQASKKVTKKRQHRIPNSVQGESDSYKEICPLNVFCVYQDKHKKNKLSNNKIRRNAYKYVNILYEVSKLW